MKGFFDAFKKIFSGKSQTPAPRPIHPPAPKAETPPFEHKPLPPTVDTAPIPKVETSLPPLVEKAETPPPPPVAPPPVEPVHTPPPPVEQAYTPPPPPVEQAQTPPPPPPPPPVEQAHTPPPPPAPPVEQTPAPEPPKKEEAPVAQTPPPPVQSAPEVQPPATGGSTEAVKASIDAMLTFARTLIGTPYLIGGTTPKAFDCSGFVGYVHREASNIQLPRTSVDQAKVGTKIDAKQARKGDLVFFTHHGTKVDHVGIITSDEGKSLMMIHASTSKGVIESDLAHSEYWMSRITHFQRIR